MVTARSLVPPDSFPEALDSLPGALEFVQTLKLPPKPVVRPKKRVGRAPRTGREAELDLEAAPRPAVTAFEQDRDEAAVVGSDIVSFARGIAPERRRALLNSSLLAQLAARKSVPDAHRIYDWYHAYFHVLTNIGWHVQDRGFAEYRESGAGFEAHDAILKVAAILLASAPTALAVVTGTLKALRSMDKNSPWITLFDRESQHQNAARFQVTLAQEQDGQPYMTLMAFGLEAEAEITQVLFFKARSTEATLKHMSGQVTINADILDNAAAAIEQRVQAFQRDFILKIPI